MTEQKYQLLMYCNKAPACCIPGPQHCANHVVLGICSHISKKPWILSNTDTNRTGHNTRPGPTLGVHVRGGESLRRRGRRKENVPGRGQSPRSSREYSVWTRLRDHIDLQLEPCTVNSKFPGKSRQGWPPESWVSAV